MFSKKYRLVLCKKMKCGKWKYLFQISSEENVAEGSKSKIVLDLEITFPEVTSLVPQPCLNFFG